jgi:hypothetical protein
MITYAGLDVITTYNNYEVLNYEILPNAYDKAFDNYRMLLKGHYVFANMTQRGIPIGENEFDEINLKLDEAIDNVIKEISDIPEFIEYNDYLKDKVTNVKSNDATIKSLIESTKRKDINNDEQGTHGRINRKVSFS